MLKTTPPPPIQERMGFCKKREKTFPSFVVRYAAFFMQRV